MNARHIINFQWKSYWRSFNVKRKTERRFFLLVFLLIPYLLGPSIKSLSHIVDELQAGNSQDFGSLLLGIFLAWVLLPLMANDSYLSITPIGLIRFPVPKRALFLIECAGVMIQPISWLLIAASFTLVVPLFSSSAPFIRLLTGFSFIIFSFFFSIFLKHFFYQGRVIKKLFIITVAVPLVFAVLYLYGSEITNFLFCRRPLPGLVVIAGLTALSLFAAYKSFFHTGSGYKRKHITTGKKMLFKFIKIPGKLGTLIQKDFYYFASNNNILISLCIMALYIYYLITEGSPAVDSFLILFLFIFIPNITFSLNSLGFESGLGIERYILFPLPGYRVLLSKNLAYLMLVLIQFLPVFLLGWLKFGAYIILLGFIEMLSVALLLLFWGNIISVLQPVPLQFHRFNLVSLQTAIPFTISIFIVHIGVFRAVDTYRLNPDTALMSQLVFLIGCLILYFISLIRSGKILEKRLVRIKDQLR